MRDGKLEDELIEYLLSIGALEFSFFDDDGSKVYKLTPQAKELVPNLYDEHIKDFNSKVFSLWNREMLDLSFDDDGDPLIAVNQNSYDEEKVKGLEKNEKEVLTEIIAVWEKKQKNNE